MIPNIYVNTGVATWRENTLSATMTGGCHGAVTVRQ